MAHFFNSDRGVYLVLGLLVAVALLLLAWDLFDRSSLGGRLYVWRANRRIDRRRRRRARGL